MSKIYNKLVRDNIPNIIKVNGENPTIRILENSEYKEELEKKLYEEYNEVINAKTSEERIEELADLLEVINSLAQCEENKSLDDVIRAMNKKREKRGGFTKRIFLEKVD